MFPPLIARYIKRAGRRGIALSPTLAEAHVIRLLLRRVGTRTTIRAVLARKPHRP